MSTKSHHVDYENDSMMDEISLDSDKPECAIECLQRQFSDFRMIIRTLASSTCNLKQYLMKKFALSRVLVDNLDGECTTRGDEDDEMIKPQEPLLGKILENLESELGDNDLDSASVTSASSENSDFVGGITRDVKIWRHQLSMRDSCPPPSMVMISDFRLWQEDTR